MRFRMRQRQPTGASLPEPDARSRAADAELKDQLAKAVIERDRSQMEAAKLRAHLERIKRAVKDEPDDDGGPW